VARRPDLARGAAAGARPVDPRAAALEDDPARAARPLDDAGGAGGPGCRARTRGAAPRRPRAARARPGLRDEVPAARRRVREARGSRRRRRRALARGVTDPVVAVAKLET